VDFFLDQHPVCGLFNYGTAADLGQVEMVKCSIPVQTACSGVEIRSKTLGKGVSEKAVPAITVSLSIDIPVEELLAALTYFQQAHPPQPDAVPNAFAEKATGGRKEVKQSQGYSAAAGPPGLAAPPPAMDDGGAVAKVGAMVPPPGLTAQWETLNAIPPSMRSMFTRVKVYNLVKRLRYQDVQYAFERHVGPVAQCSLADDCASIAFVSPEHAQAAVERYDGGVLEVSTDKSIPAQDSLCLYPKDASFRRTLEDRLGPLSQCHLRRGGGWMTLFRGDATKQLKREEALNQIDFKGSVIAVSLDALGPMNQLEGLVVGAPVVL